MTRHRTRIALASAALALAAGAAVLGAHRAGPAEAWTADELATLRSLSLASLGPLRADPSNRWGDDPRAAALGHRLFFDTRLSGDGTVACATCHLPGKQFQDGTPLATGVGTTDRRTMPIVGTAHGAWLFWDGRKDSQWSQALGPLESPVEHGGDRTQYAHLVATHYRAEYEAVFGRLPSLDGLPASAGPVADARRGAAWSRIPPARQDEISRVYANVGKAIAAYERRLEYGPSRFDRWVDAVASGRAPDAASALGPDELAGLRIFIGKGSCTNCHNGPLFTDDHFHNTGVPAVAALPKDDGRAAGVAKVLADEFNCLGRYSDARPEECGELRFAAAGGEELVRAYKTPSLRNVAERPPYMHAGQYATLEEVVRHYDRAPRAPAGHSELRPLHLSDEERAQLAAFLRTLSGPIAAPAELLAAPTARRTP
jgi:cytochrome c peroxidase